MNKFYGTANFDLGGANYLVQICLNLEEDTLELRWSVSDPKELFELQLQNGVSRSRAKLTDIQIELPTGSLRKDSYDDFFVSSFSVGGFSDYDSLLTRAFDVRGRDDGITRAIIQPKNSRLEFDFIPQVKRATQYELFYSGIRTDVGPPKQLRLGSVDAVVAGDKKGLSVRAESSLLQEEELFRLAWGVTQGGPATLRSILDGDRIILNLAAHRGTGAGRLFQKPDDGPLLLQGLLDWFHSLSADDSTLWTRATFFYLHGVGGTTPLEIRAINLLTFIEMIDRSDTLNKTAVANLLGLETDGADLVCRVRNRLIHRGQSIGSAVLRAYEELLGHKESLTITTFLIDRNDQHRTGVHFFFRLASLINRLWISKAGFTREWNDYSEYLP